MDNSKLGDVLKNVEETNTWFQELRDQESPARKNQNRKKKQQKQRAEQRRKEELKAAQERKDRQKEEAAQAQVALKALVQRASERQAASEAYDDAVIAKGYLQGRGFWTVTKELAKEAEMLETLMNFNGYLNETFPDGADTVEYHKLFWAVGKHSVTRRLYVLGLRDPLFIVKDREREILTVEALCSPRQPFPFTDFSPLVWILTSLLLVGFAQAAV